MRELRMLNVFIDELKRRIEQKTNWGKNQLLDEVEDIEKYTRIKYQDELIHHDNKVNKHDFTRVGG